MNKNTFIFGVSTAAHQVEGYNTNDWSEWELANAERLARESEEKFSKKVPDWNAIAPEATDPKNYISGAGVDHYNRYKEDIDIIASLGLKAYRFSVEWSRIEPKEGEWNEEALEHYAGVIRYLKSKGIEPWITLWHRTNPLWIRDIGDWSNKKTVDYYIRFVKKVLEKFHADVNHWMPLNEPVMSMGGGYLTGEYPPNKKNPIVAWRVLNNFAKAHNEAYKLIHSYQPESFVGMPHAAFYLEAYENKWINRLTVKLGHYFANWLLLDKIKDHTDFIGIQYYTRGIVNWFHQVEVSSSAEATADSTSATAEATANKPGLKTDMGWEVYPKGIRKIMELAWKRYGLPMVVTENGVTDARDSFRAQAINDTIAEILKTREEGIDVRGYFYWSLLDNLEWDKGFWPKFGLVSVDRNTMVRTVRASAWEYKKIIEKETA